MSDSEISILYVDDESDFLQIAQLYLKSYNIIVDTDQSAQKALHTRNLDVYDAILSDYQMPGMDGISFLKEVRRLVHDMPFILFTGRGREEVAISAIENGADYYVQKGVDFESQFSDLIHKINLAISRRKIERELRESEEAFRLAFENAKDAIFWLDISTGIVVKANVSAEKLIGCSRDKFIGKTWNSLQSSERSDEMAVHEHDNAPSFPVLFRSGEAVILTKAETKIPVMISTSETKIGETEILQGIFQDISGRKKVEDAIKANEEKFRLLTENAADVIFRMALPSGVCEYMSPSSSSVLGYSPEEFYERPRLIQHIIPDEWQPYLARTWQDLEKGKFPSQYEFQILKKTGERRWMSQRNQLFFDGDGNPIALEGIINDITGMKEIESALRRSEEQYRSLFLNLPIPVMEGDFSGVKSFLNYWMKKGLLI